MVFLRKKTDFCRFGQLRDFWRKKQQQQTNRKTKEEEEYKKGKSIIKK